MPWMRPCFFALVALAILQTIYYYPKMPEVVASHFDGLGAPDAWSGRNGFFAFYLAIVAMVIGIFDWLPRWSGRRANFGMKIPNRDHWLSPQRIETTKAFFQRQMLLMGILHLLLAIYTIQLVILANLGAAPRLHPSIFWALLLYFVFVAGWLFYFHRYFRNP